MRMGYRSDPSGGPVQNVFNGTWLTAAGRNFEPWFRAAARGNLEVFTLMGRRAQAYAELPMRISQCRTPQDLANEQMRFWQTMARQYTDSSQRVLGAWVEIAKQNLAQGEKGKPERDYITFPEPEPSAADERRAA